MRFHLLGLAHVETKSSNSSCPFTQKIVKLARILKSYGHTVLFYGIEGSEVECDEFIQVLTQDELYETYGDFDKSTEFFKMGNDYKPNIIFSQNTIKEITKRKQKNDILLCTLGNYQKTIIDSVNMLTVESGIGYSGVYAKYRIYESYAWMHYIYGIEHKELGGWYDAVIPNYYDIDEFPYINTKQDYLIYLGRIVGSKGVQTASDIAKATGHKLYVVGQGKLNNPEEGVDLDGEEHIIYMPAVGPEKRAELLGNAKAVLMPTYYIEPFGSVAIEAQLCGTPIITTDWGAFPETVVHGVTGYRCRVFEEFCWAIDNIDKIKPADCRKWAIDNYSLERVGKMYEEYFRRISRLSENGWYQKNDERDELDWLKKYYV